MVKNGRLVPGVSVPSNCRHHGQQMVFLPVMPARLRAPCRRPGPEDGGGPLFRKRCAEAHPGTRSSPEACRRQQSCKMPMQILCPTTIHRGGNYVGHQLRRIGALHRGGGISHLRVGTQGGLHLGRLDAVPAQFHLLVQAPEKLQLAVRQTAPEIAGAVQTSTRPAPKGIGQEALCGQRWLVPISARHSFTSDGDLARKLTGDGPEQSIQQVDLRPVDGAADRRRLLAAANSAHVE